MTEPRPKIAAKPSSTKKIQFCLHSTERKWNFSLSDFNFHLDAINNTDARRFNNIIEFFNLKQHVNGSTHKNGHTLDLIITRSEESFVTDVVVNDPALSDHLAVSTVI